MAERRDERMRELLLVVVVVEGREGARECGNRLLVVAVEGKRESESERVRMKTRVSC